MAGELNACRKRKKTYSVLSWHDVLFLPASDSCGPGRACNECHPAELPHAGRLTRTVSHGSDTYPHASSGFLEVHTSTRLPDCVCLEIDTTYFKCRCLKVPTTRRSPAAVAPPPGEGWPGPCHPCLWESAGARYTKGQGGGRCLTRLSQKGFGEHGRLGAAEGPVRLQTRRVAVALRLRVVYSRSGPKSRGPARR